MEPEIALVTGATERVGKASAVESGNPAVDVLLAGCSSLAGVRRLARAVSGNYPRAANRRRLWELSGKLAGLA